MKALGAFAGAEGVTFRAWSTRAKRVAVELFTQDAKVARVEPMRGVGDGVFEVTLKDAAAGALYKFRVDDESLPDPYARFLPQGVHAAGEVMRSAHVWKADAWVGRPLAELVIYELHVGTFTPEGTYAAARARLPELAELGVTAIELMPLSSFPGERGWGYDGVAHFAPHAPYGTPDELRALVDDAHAHGLSVLLDVVYNHFGPSGNYLGAYSPEYFTNEFPTPWGAAPNYAHPRMRAFATDNARYWLEEFRFDGLRLDATHSIYDVSAKHILREIAEVAHEMTPRRVLIAEDERNEPSIVDAHGLDAIWADDFHHQLHALFTGETDGYYAAFEPKVLDLARTIERGWLYEGQTWAPSGKARGRPAGTLTAPSLVYCLQNHDQIGNRALGDRLTAKVPLANFCAASMLLLFLPMTPLLFMGQEWGASSPFLYFTDHEAELGRLVSRGRRDEFKEFAAFSDPGARERIPDPQARETFLRSKLDWAEREQPAHREVTELVRHMLSLRRHDAVLAASERAGLYAEARGSVLVVRRSLGREHRLLIVSFAAEPVGITPTDVAPRAWLPVIASSEGAWVKGELAPSGAVIFRATETVG